MCKGVSINSKAASFKFAPRKLASCRSLPDKSQFCKYHFFKKRKHEFTNKATSKSAPARTAALRSQF